jgi:hypothetical protein
MSSKIQDFQKSLLTDAKARKAFADNPGKFLKDLGIELPKGLAVPKKIPLADIETQVKEVNEGLKEQKVTLESVSQLDPFGVTRFVEETIPLRTADVRAMRTALDRLDVVAGGASAVGPGARATVAVVGAVVAAVVAIPVAVYGRAVRELENFVGPATGIEGFTRGAGGFTLHAPGGVRVEGLTVDAVAELVQKLKTQK